MAQKIKTNILCSIIFFAHLVVYEKMWKKLVGPKSLQMKIWPICIACWIPMAKDTHPECVTLIDFPSSNGYTPCLNVALYVHCLSFLIDGLSLKKRKSENCQMNTCSLTEKGKEHATKEDPTSGTKSALSSHKETSSNVESDGLKMVSGMKKIRAIKYDIS